MQYLNRLTIIVTFIMGTSMLYAQTEDVGRRAGFSTIEFNSTDGLKITADFYQAENAKSPFIILYHQARYSRGEYREIAPHLNALGFNCLAVDQRSGDEVNNVRNETHARAIARGLPTGYTDALPDLAAALNYVKGHLKAEKIIIWGSSYSSALAFVLAKDYPELVDGVLSFSPGDYFEIDGKTMSDFAQQVNCPVFITSAKDEQESWQPIYGHLATKNKSFYLPETDGYHGSKALWKEHPGHEGYWNAVKSFLKNFE